MRQRACKVQHHHALWRHFVGCLVSRPSLKIKKKKSTLLSISSSLNDHRYTVAVTRMLRWTYRSSVVRVVFVWLFSSIVVFYFVWCFYFIFTFGNTQRKYVSLWPRSQGLAVIISLVPFSLRGEVYWERAQVSQTVMLLWGDWTVGGRDFPSH